MYSGEYDTCDVTLSVYPHRASLKNMPDHGGNRTYDLWNTSPILVPNLWETWLEERFSRYVSTPFPSSPPPDKVLVTYHIPLFDK